MRFSLSFVIGCALCQWAPALAADLPPKFDILISPTSMEAPVFKVKGSIFYCPGTKKARVYIPEGTDFVFTRNGSTITVPSESEINWECAGNTREDLVYFEGTAPLNRRKCGVAGGEVYCLNKSYPNPEVVADSSLYELRFDLPEGYGALAPSSQVESGVGIQFQLARFGEPVRRKTKRFSFEYLFPEGFSSEPAYMGFIENTLEGYLDVFGPLAFRDVRIGAIRRGQDTGEISGSPAGNLILFSRTALKDKPNLDGLKPLGITSDVSDAMRKMVIAHELSHFWFGLNYQGKDGWMLEGIPNYLGLVAVRKGSEKDYLELLKMFHYMDAKVPPAAPIPGQPFGGGNLYITAYYQGALALSKIGESVGHDKLIGLIAEVYKNKTDPAFADFDTSFKLRYPKQAALWDAAWRVGVK